MKKESNYNNFSELHDANSNMRIGELLDKQVLNLEELDDIHFKKIKRRKILYKILVVVGMMPYVLLVLLGIDAYKDGYSFLWSSKTYGWKGFFLQIQFFSLLFWPVLVLGLLLIIVSIVKLKRLS